MNNSIYFRLNKNIDINYLVKSIEQLLKSQSITESSILKIEIINISQEYIPDLPKLEQKI